MSIARGATIAPTRGAIADGLGRRRARVARAKAGARWGRGVRCGVGGDDGAGRAARDANADDGWARAKRATKMGAIAALVMLSAPKAAGALETGAREARREGARSAATASARRAPCVGEVAGVGIDIAPVDSDPKDEEDETAKLLEELDAIAEDKPRVVEAPTKQRRRRRRGTVKKKKMNLEHQRRAPKQGGQVDKVKVMADRVKELVGLKTGEHTESRNRQLSAAEEKVLKDIQRYEKYEQEKKNPVKKIFSNRGERFVRNVNLAYLRDPYSTMGTDRFPTETSYTSFHRLLDVGRVNRVVYRANETSIRYYIDDTEEVFGCNLPYDPVLFKKLVTERPGNGGVIQIEMEKYPRWLEITAFLFNALTPMVMVFYAWLIYEGTYKDSSEDMFGNMTTRNYDSNVRQGMTLKDITGIDNVKAEMFELISYLKDFDKYNSMGARIPAGVLLCGPPGTGKTLLARCVAGEANVPFFSCAGTEFMEMFVGVGAARIRNLFDQAKKVAPCIIFIDEFDAVGTKRTETQSGQVYGNDEATATINQMLTEMDGFSTATGIMVLAATNRPQVLDPALIRAGRFDRIIEMGLPNKKSRQEILFLHCNKPSFASSVDPNLDYEYLARQTAGFSGADIENLTKSAVMRCAQGEKALASTGDFLFCIDDIRRSQAFVRNGSGSGSLARDRMLEDTLIAQLDAYERDSVVNYYAAQAVVAMHMPSYDEISKVTVFNGGVATGQIVYVPDEVDSPAARTVRSMEYYEAKLCVLLAGQMAERYLYGPENVTTRGMHDVAAATNLACEMVMQNGWSDLGPIALAAEPTREEGYLRVGKTEHIEVMRQLSPELDLLVYNEVRKTLIKAAQRTVAILHEPKNREMLFSLKESLATAREIGGRQLAQAFEKAGITRDRGMGVWDIAWGEQQEVYWDDLMSAIWSDDPSKGKFWGLVKDQIHSMASAEEGVPLPDWAEHYLTQMSDEERLDVAIVLPDDAARKWLEQSGGIPPEYANLRAQADELARKDVERRAAARQAAIERGEIDP